MKRFLLSALLVLGLFLPLTESANAQGVCGQDKTCVTSFTISPSTVQGDGSQTASASVTATLANGANGFELELGGTVGAVYACGPPSTYLAPDPTGAGFLGGCRVSGSSVQVGFSGKNGGSSNITLHITADAGYNNDTGITQPLTITPIPNPNETPSQDPDGPCPQCGNAGAPINVLNGNTWIGEQDYSMPGIAGGFTLTRTWNSLWPNMIPPEESGIFGDSWRSNIEERIQVLAGQMAKYWKGNGSSLFYSTSGGGVYTMTAPADDLTTLSYNSGTSQWTATEKNGTRRVFNAAGYLISIIDLNGNTTTINVDANNQNRIATVTDASGHVVTFNYANVNFPRLCTSISDSVGTFSQYVYDTSGRLSQVQYPDGSQYNFQFNDPNSNTLITGVLDSASKVIETHSYDSQRRGLTSTRANDSTGHAVDNTSMTYGSSSPWQNRLCFTTAQNTQFCTDITVSNVAQRHYLVAASGPNPPCASCGFSGQFNATLSPTGYKTTNTDSNSHTIFYAYDGQGNVLFKTLPEGNNFTGPAPTGYDTWAYTYNSYGEVLTVTDPLGYGGVPNHTTTYGYGSHGILTSITTPSPDGTTAASVTQFTPNAQGQITKITDPLSNATTIVYCTTNQTNCPTV